MSSHDVSFASLEEATAQQVSDTLQRLLADVSALVAYAEAHDAPEAVAKVRGAVAEVMVTALNQLGKPLLGAWDSVLPSHLKAHLATAPALELGATTDEEITTDEHEASS
jgi:hypothetical protein